MTIFKIIFPSSKNGEMLENYYIDEEQTRLNAFLRTIVSSGRVAIVSEGDFDSWKRQEDRMRFLSGDYNG